MQLFLLIDDIHIMIDKLIFKLLKQLDEERQRIVNVSFTHSLVHVPDSPEYSFDDVF